MAGMYTSEKPPSIHPSSKEIHISLEEVKARAETGDPNAQRALETRKALARRGIIQKDY